MAFIMMSDGNRYLTKEETGQRLSKFLATKPKEKFINVDGNILTIASIDEVLSNEEWEAKHNTQPPTRTDIWKEAIKRNCAILQQTGKMGRLTADDLLAESTVKA